MDSRYTQTLTIHCYHQTPFEKTSSACLFTDTHGQVGSAPFYSGRVLACFHWHHTETFCRPDISKETDARFQGFPSYTLRQKDHCRRLQRIPESAF